MSTLPFQQSFTWRKLGYLFYGSSLDYRSAIEENPQWSVMTLPPVGAQLRLPEVNSTSATLSQSDFMYGFDSSTTQEQVFPFNTEQEYAYSLNKYSFSAVNQRGKVNGYTLDSLPALTGIQG